MTNCYINLLNTLLIHTWKDIILGVIALASSNVRKQLHKRNSEVGMGGSLFPF
jgi:hypothetical protein